jgi:hypothetical protein
MSSVTSDVCKGGVYLLYLRSCAFKYRNILYSTVALEELECVLSAFGVHRFQQWRE